MRTDIESQDSATIRTIDIYRQLGYAEHRALKKVLFNNVDAFRFTGFPRAVRGIEAHPVAHLRVICSQ